MIAGRAVQGMGELSTYARSAVDAGGVIKGRIVIGRLPDGRRSKRGVRQATPYSTENFVFFSQESWAVVGVARSGWREKKRGDATCTTCTPEEARAVVKAG